MEKVVPSVTEKSFVIISKVLPSQQFDDWPDVVESKEPIISKTNHNFHYNISILNYP